MSNKKKRIEGRNGDREKNRVENGSDTSAGNVSDLEKDINATSAANDGKGYNEATQEANQSDKGAQSLMTRTGIPRAIDEKETITFNLMLLISMKISHLKRLQKRLLSS